MLLSLVIPCYNEEAVLELSLNTLLDDLKNFGISDYEIVCVDDGSKDRTLEILHGYCSRSPQIKAVSFAAGSLGDFAFRNIFNNSSFLR